MSELQHHLSQFSQDFCLIRKGILSDLIQEFQSQMKSGLEGQDQSSLAMIDSFIQKSNQFAPGHYLGLDLSGTNFRVLVVTIGEDQKIKSQPKVHKFFIPSEVKAGPSATKEKLFDFVADKIKEALDKENLSKENLNIGFTFAFPTRADDVAKGKLIKWTKNWNVPDLVGKDPVEALHEAFERKGLTQLKVNALVNDTVGAMVLGFFNDRTTTIGAILGTGANICSWVKDRSYNFESGNFDFGSLRDKVQTPYDEVLDSSSINPKEQLLEKMVSGKYLGELLRIILKDLIAKKVIFNGNSTSVLDSPFDDAKNPDGLVCDDITRMLSDDEAMTGTNESLKRWGIDSPSMNEVQFINQLGWMLMRRSAQLSGSIMAATLLYLDPSSEEKHSIAIDGSLFECAKGYPEFMKEVFSEISGLDSEKIDLTLTKDGSGVGAALSSSIVFASN